MYIPLVYFLKASQEHCAQEGRAREREGGMECKNTEMASVIMSYNFAQGFI